MDHELKDIVSLTQSLISARGVSGEEKDAADVVIRAMEALGFRTIVRDDYGSVIGLVGPEDADTVLLFDGHIDVVPVTGNWSVDPFGGEIRNGRLYGRGSTDMKGAVASAIFGVAAAAKARKLKKQVAVSASVMEEVLEGVALGKILDIYQPEAVVICEPSMLELMIGQRGRQEIVISLLGKSAHTSQSHLDENPVELAAQALGHLHDIDYLQDPILGKGVLVPVSIVSDPLPSPSMVPMKTIINFDRRTVSGENLKIVFEQIRDCLMKNGIRNFTLECSASPIKTYTGVELCPDRDFPSWTISADHSLVKSALDAIKRSGLPEKIGFWNCCTNGSESAGKRGFPTIGVGPGDIRDAHTVDESIEVSQLIKAAELYKNIVLVFA